MKSTKRAALLAAFLSAWTHAALAQHVSIETRSDAGRIRMGAYDHSAWAVCSLKVRGHEYIDGYDHGRCLQSAASFDGQGQAFNPTQAGGVFDGEMPADSSSQPVKLRVQEHGISSTVRMAFWEPVEGERTSDYVHHQSITLGLGPLRNVIAHKITFTLPHHATHRLGQFEILTGYMPPEFLRFRTLDPATGTLTDLTDGPGEQPHPVVFCTHDERHCMGVISSAPLEGGGYGRWRFEGDACMTRQGATGCVKWNVVTRIADPPRHYRAPPIFTAVGPLDDVVAGLRWAWASGRH